MTQGSSDNFSAFGGDNLLERLAKNVTPRKVETREDREKRIQAEREASQKQIQTAQRDRTLNVLKGRYLKVPGMTEADWEKNKEDVLAEFARSQAINGNADPEFKIKSLIDLSRI